MSSFFIHHLVFLAFSFYLQKSSSFPLAYSRFRPIQKHVPSRPWLWQPWSSQTSQRKSHGGLYNTDASSYTVYVNGEYKSAKEATVSVFDRGFMFADSVYEVTAVVKGKLVDHDYHVARLNRSLNELSMPAPFGSDEELLQIQLDLITRNQIDEGLIYLQCTRGATLERDFLYPTHPQPTLVVIPQRKNIVHSPLAERGAKIVTMEDIRWGRRDIKTTQLLAQSMAKQAAKEAGVDDAWMYEGDTNFITEGSSANAFILTKDDRLITRGLGNEILPGITRQVILALAEESNDMIASMEERPFTREEALKAKEAFFTSSTSFVIPVVEINGVAIGDGKPGPCATRLRQLYIERALAL